MKKRSLVLATVITFLTIIGVMFAEEFRSPVVFKNDVDFDTGSNLKIQGTKVTSSAAELNIMDGVTATAAEINAAGGGTTATLTPTLVSNATSKVYCSNLVVKAGGTVTLPSASLDSAALPATIDNSTLVSNANLKVYGLTLEIKSGGTVTVPAGSIASASIAGSKTYSYITLTNVVYEGGAVTANVNVVRWQ